MNCDTICLACGCIILNNSVWDHCTYHYTTQPSIGDPLYNFIISRGEIDYESDPEVH